MRTETTPETIKPLMQLYLVEKRFNALLPLTDPIIRQNVFLNLLGGTTNEHSQTLQSVLEHAHAIISDQSRELSPTQKIHLLDSLGFSHRDICEILNVSRPTVRNRLQYQMQPLYINEIPDHIIQQAQQYLDYLKANQSKITKVRFAE